MKVCSSESHKTKVLHKRSRSFDFENEKIKKAKLLVQLSGNIDGPERKKRALLYEAAKHGHYQIFESFIRDGAFLDFALPLERSEERGFTLLHLIVQGNHIECAKLLLEHGASVSSKIEGVCHPIHLAVFNNNVELASLLLDYGADVNLKFSNDFFEKFEPPLHCSLWQDHNLPLLHYSILRNYRGMTKLLITRDADVNLKTSLEKTTLMQAVEVNNPDLVKFLIKKKNANVNDRDIFGQPVLHFLILNAKTKVSMYNKEEYGLSTLKCQILDELYYNGVDIDARFPQNKERSSIIHYSIKYGYSIIVFSLLLHRINCDFSEIDLTSIQSAQISTQDITPEIESNHEFLTVLIEEFKETNYTIVKRAIRDQMMGLPVDKNLILEKPFHDWHPIEIYKHIIGNYREDLTFRINDLKRQKVDNSNISVWHLLTCDINQLVKLMSKKVVRDFKIVDEKEEIEEGMMDFWPILKYRLCFAKKRKQLLEDCAEIIFNLYLPYIPYHCCENIVNNLNNQELIILHPSWIDMYNDRTVIYKEKDIDVEQL